MRCRIDNDKWIDLGKVFFVHSAETHPGSTATTLVLEDDDGNIHKRVVASHQIEWIDDDGDN